MAQLPNQVQIEHKTSIRFVNEKKSTAKRGKTKSKQRIQKYLIKLPKINNAFQAIQKSFSNYIENFSALNVNSQSIQAENLVELLSECGINVSFEEAQNLFTNADFDASESIEIKEFLIVVGLAYTNSNEDTVNQECELYATLSQGYDIIQQMWHAIDEEQTGVLTRQSIGDAFGFTEEEVGRMMHTLDFDGNGEIDYPEFIFGITAWVGVEEDEEEEAMEQNIKNAETVMDAVEEDASMNTEM